MDGYEYTYAVTAYDMGVSGAELDEKVYIDSADNTFYTLDTLYLANPQKWAAPFGYESLENSRGTLEQDKNFVTIIPGVQSADRLSSVKVVPNPYIVHSRFNEDEYLSQIMFTNLTSRCTIKVYTVSGELVATLEHDDVNGFMFWDLRTINNQEVAPGLYLFTVESDGSDDFVGKFAVIR